MDRQKHTGLEAILEQLIEHGADDMANILARMFELAMRIERERFLGARHYERTPNRRDHANGSKSKRNDTLAGSVTVQAPKTAGHEGEPFCPQSLERGRRSVHVVMRRFGIESLSSSQVSRATKMPDEELTAWRNRPLGETR